MELFEKFRQHFDELIIIFLISLLSMVVYLLSENTPMKARVKLAFLGFFISMIVSLPTYYTIGFNNLWALVFISAIFTVCGQFLPELVQTLFKKFVKKQVSERFGVSEDDDTK